MIMMAPIILTYAPDTVLCTHANLLNEMKDIKKSRTNRQVKGLYLTALGSLKKKTRGLS